MSYRGNRSVLALTFDHEMSTNFPYRSSVWDHRKGDIDAETRAYVSEELALAAEFDGQFTYFLVASMLELHDIEYLQRAIEAGHEMGNHTYSHVNVTAHETDALRGMYSSQPWMVGQRSAPEIIRDEIAIANALIEEKLGVQPRGFRTPYGFPGGVKEQAWLTSFLLDAGINYVSSQYSGWDLWDDSLAGAGIDNERLLTDLYASQPFEVNGLLEIPIATPSDCHVFRSWQWRVEQWLEIVKTLIDLSYEHELVLTLCCHPSILATCDPYHLTICTAIEHARTKQDGVLITTLATLAEIINGTPG